MTASTRNPKSTKKAEPCHFCKKPTKRQVRFGYCTYFTPCCVTCAPFEEGTDAPKEPEFKPKCIRRAGQEDPCCLERGHEGPCRLMFKPEEALPLHGFSPQEVKRIRAITIALVTSRVEKGEVNPDKPGELKAAIIEAGHTARSAYAAALEYLAG